MATNNPSQHGFHMGMGYDITIGDGNGTRIGETAHCHPYFHPLYVSRQYLLIGVITFSLFLNKIGVVTYY